MRTSGPSIHGCAGRARCPNEIGAIWDERSRARCGRRAGPASPSARRRNEPTRRRGLVEPLLEALPLAQFLRWGAKFGHEARQDWLMHLLTALAAPNA